MTTPGDDRRQEAARLQEAQPDDRALFTVGHGTSEAGPFVDLLRTARIDTLVDVRAHPGSRRVPHMARPALEQWLPDAGIAYRWEPRLGGRRRTSPSSVNVALTDASFRGYADYMSTSEFVDARAELLRDLGDRRTVVMCAESVWWRCHRRLIADAVELLDHVRVVHLFHDGRLVPHPPMAVARVDGDHLVYDRAVDSE
jgi:uncharacterized protein (DUF488 family)